MKSLSGEELRSWIENDQNLEDLYQQLLSSLINHVKMNGGTEQDAKDLFQESMVVLYRKSLEDDFVLTASVNTYVFSIAKRMWLSQLRKRRNDQTRVKLVYEADNEIAEMIMTNEREELFLKHFKKLKDQCKELLNLFFGGSKMTEIAAHFGFASDGYARKRKHKCQEQLVKSIKEDPIFAELRDE